MRSVDASSPDIAQFGREHGSSIAISNEWKLQTCSTMAAVAQLSSAIQSYCETTVFGGVLLAKVASGKLRNRAQDLDQDTAKCHPQQPIVSSRGCYRKNTGNACFFFFLHCTLLT